MKNKLLLTASLSGIACLSVIMAGSLLSKNQSFNAVRSTATNYELIMNKDTIYPDYCYSQSGFRATQYAFFQLHNPGNYALINDLSSSSCTYGGNHLYDILINGSGKKVCFFLDINAMRTSGDKYYFDKEKTRQIYMPGFDTANLNEIEITVNKDNDIPFDSSIFDANEHVEANGNTYTISNITNNRSGISLFDFMTTSDQVNKHLIIDQVIVRYTCGQPQ